MRSRTCCAAAASAAIGSAYWLTMSSSSQALGRFPHRVDDATRRIALTFDDGPNEPYTSQVARVLDRAGVRGTFFQVGRAVRRAPESTLALREAGHVVGNHSYSHQYTRGFRAGDIAEEVDRAQEAFAQCAGIVPALYRPPWLVRTPALFRVLEDRDMTPVSGTFCHPFEVAQIAAGKIAHRAQVRARPGSVIIFHDGYNGVGAFRGNTVAALDQLVESLLTAGYALVTVDQLFATRAYL